MSAISSRSDWPLIGFWADSTYCVWTESSGQSSKGTRFLCYFMFENLYGGRSVHFSLAIIDNPWNWAKGGAEAGVTTVYHLCSLRSAIPPSAKAEIACVLGEAARWQGMEIGSSNGEYLSIMEKLEFKEVKVSRENTFSIPDC